MRLWDWARRVYAQPGVATALLDLQDNHGQSVGLLLWAAWAGQVRPGQLDEAIAFARVWEVEVLRPLRQVRQSLKAQIASLDDAERLTLRQSSLDLELVAEKVLLDGLERIGPARFDGHSALAMRAAGRSWSAPSPDALISRLASQIDFTSAKPLPMIVDARSGSQI